ncbi:MAG TPA: hypothetical protein VH092_06040 [Urbifossiella sp.]|nr:hypothetical protein [Urbifossiella sp.]
MTRVRPFAAFLVALAAAPAAAAAPRDDLLRVAPPDAAVVVLVQNASAHAKAVLGSPFAAWFPSSPLGKQMAAGFKIGDARDGFRAVLGALDTTPDEILTDVLGDAVGFAYTPAPGNDPAGERSVILVRPRNPATLTRLLDRFNDLQTRDGELKSVERRDYAGAAYTARRRADGADEFYALRGGVFAFSRSEADVKAVLDRDRAATPAGGERPGWGAKLARLGLADAAAVVLVNPRALDAELAAKVAAAGADERVFLARFGEAWKALDAAAVFLTLGDGVEAGVALDFRPGELPPVARSWLTGARTPSALWAAVPDDALGAVAARFRAAEVVELVRALLPEKGRAAIDAAVGGTLAPLIGRDRLPRVLEALGPDWAVWAEPPAAGAGPLPVLVGAVRLRADGPHGAEVTRAVERAVAFGFEAARVAYNTNHADQIELEEEAAADGRLTTLVGEKAFPPGVRPSFAVKGGFLVFSTSPDAIRRFRPPSDAPAAGANGEAVVARVSGPAVRAYLREHGAVLARVLGGDAAGTEQTLDQLVVLLDPIERAEVLVRGTETGIRLTVRVRLVRPLK